MFSMQNSIDTLKDKPNVLSGGANFIGCDKEDYANLKNNVEDITYYQTQDYLNVGYDNELTN